MTELGSGCLVSANTSNWIAIAFMWISPLRPVVEILFRRLLDGRNNYIEVTEFFLLGF